MKTWAQNLIQFYNELQPPQQLPNNIQWLYPQAHPAVKGVVAAFLYKFFNDTARRSLFLGINPGRFGAGITGVNFTAAKQLSEDCGIEHPFKEGSELSAEFIYDVVRAYGGAPAFYRHYFIGSVCPLGFVKEGKNINYYDDKELLKTVEPFIIQSIEKQVSFNVKREVCYCIGGEKNFRYLSALNLRHGWFKTILPLPHPRFIMQYRRKQKDDFVAQYLQTIR